jgi:hypothetical protein
VSETRTAATAVPFRPRAPQPRHTLHIFHRAARPTRRAARARIKTAPPPPWPGPSRRPNGAAARHARRRDTHMQARHARAGATRTCRRDTHVQARHASRRDTRLTRARRRGLRGRGAEADAGEMERLLVNDQGSGHGEGVPVLNLRRYMVLERACDGGRHVSAASIVLSLARVSRRALLC